MSACKVSLVKIKYLQRAMKLLILYESDAQLTYNFKRIEIRLEKIII